MPEPITEEQEVKETEPNQEEPKKEEEVYLTWQSPSRPFKKRDRNWFIRLCSLVLILCLVFVFFQWFLLVAVSVALTFVAYALSTVEPEVLEHRISSRGVTTAGRLFLYEGLKDFYFIQKYGRDILYIKVAGRVPGILIILLGDQDKNKVRDFLKKHLSFIEDAPVSFVDKLFEYVAKKLSLD